MILNGKILHKERISLAVDHYTGEVLVNITLEETIYPESSSKVFLYNPTYLNAQGTPMRYIIKAEVSPPIIFYTKGEVALMDKLTQYSQKFYGFVSKSVSIWKLVGISYLISSLMGFFNLTLFYIFLPMESLIYPVRKLIQSLFEIFKNLTSIPLFMTTVL